MHSETLSAVALLKKSEVIQSLGVLLGEGSHSALDGTSSVTEELRVDTFERRISLALGLRDAVAMGLLVLVMVSVVLRLCHPFSIYDADYIKSKNFK